MTSYVPVQSAYDYPAYGFVQERHQEQPIVINVGNAPAQPVVPATTVVPAQPTAYAYQTPAIAGAALPRARAVYPVSRPAYRQYRTARRQPIQVRRRYESARPVVSGTGPQVAVSASTSVPAAAPAVVAVPAGNNIIATPAVPVAVAKPDIITPAILSTIPIGLRDLLRDHRSYLEYLVESARNLNRGRVSELQASLQPSGWPSHVIGYAPKRLPSRLEHPRKHRKAHELCRLIWKIVGKWHEEKKKEAQRVQKERTKAQRLAMDGRSYEAQMYAVPTVPVVV